MSKCANKVLSRRANAPLLIGCSAGINTGMQEHLNIDTERLTGSTETHLVTWSGLLVHDAVVGPLTNLCQQAAQRGFDLRLCSSFRSFDRQLKIWNDKMSGLRPVYDDSGARLDLTQLTEWQQVQAVMRWSALPGASRHHWGTDFDIYDAAAVDASYQIQLVPEEVEGSGVFAPFHDWLDSSVLAATDFYRPYAKDLGGIAPERGHISYRPVAENYAAQLTVAVLAERLEGADILHKATVLANLDELFQRYISVKN
jgi:LAS superfamily LD-carboxypeptidase LdcB